MVYLLSDSEDDDEIRILATQDNFGLASADDPGLLHTPSHEEALIEAYESTEIQAVDALKGYISAGNPRRIAQYVASQADMMLMRTETRGLIDKPELHSMCCGQWLMGSPFNAYMTEIVRFLNAQATTRKTLFIDCYTAMQIRYPGDGNKAWRLNRKKVEAFGRNKIWEYDDVTMPYNHGQSHWSWITLSIADRYVFIFIFQSASAGPFHHHLLLLNPFSLYLLGPSDRLLLLRGTPPERQPLFHQSDSFAQRDGAPPETQLPSYLYF